MSVLLAYLFYFVAASASPLQRRWLATNRNPDNAGQISFAFQVGLIVSLLSLFIPFFQPFYLTGNIWHVIGLAIISGIFSAASYISSYTAQKHIEAGVSSLVSNIYTPVTIVLASVLLGESLTSIQIVGTALLLLGIIVVSKKHRTGRFTFDKYFLLMAFSGVMLAVVLVAERALQKITGFTATSILSWWSSSLCLGLIVLATKNKNHYSGKDIAVTGTLRFFQNLSWVTLIFVVGNLSIVSSVTTFKVVLMFMFGATLLGEREDMGRKIIGSLIALVGLLLMK